MSDKQQQQHRPEATELADQELDAAVGGLKKSVTVKRREDPCAGGE